MGNRVFILFFMIIVLSFLFVIFVPLLLRLRASNGIRIRGIVWAVFFAALTIPFFDVFGLIDLRLFTNYTGGLRIEILKAASGSIIVSDLFIPKNFLDAAKAVCMIVVYARIVTSAGHFTYVFSGYLNNLHFLTRHSEECHDDKIKLIYDRARKKAGLRRQPSLRVMLKEIHLSPCTCGIIFPSVYIGKEILYDYSDERLELVFLHELTHIKHRDSLLKLMTLAVTSAFSFIPFTKMLARAVSEDAEYRCDAAVIKKTGADSVGEYMAMIIDVAERNMKNEYTGYDFLSAASRSGELLLSRYRAMKERTDGKKHILLVPMIAAVFAVNIGILSSVSVTNIDDLGVDLADPLLEKAVCAYFDICDPRDITESVIDSVYSLEYRLSDYSDLISGITGSGYSAAVIINEGLIYDGEVYSPPVSSAEDIKLTCDLIERAVNQNRFSLVLPQSEAWNEILRDKYIDSGSIMYLPELDPDEVLRYLTEACSDGEFNVHYIGSRTVDTRDAALFGGLRTLILSDRLNASDESVYMADSYAVIRRGEHK